MYKITPLRTIAFFSSLMVALLVACVCLYSNNHDTFYLYIMALLVGVLFIAVWLWNKNKQDYIIIDNNGIEIFFEEHKIFFPWEDIQKIVLDRNGSSGLRLRLMLTREHEKYDIDFGRASLWSTNFYTLRKQIVIHSKRKDIIKVKSRQWYLKWI